MRPILQLAASAVLPLAVCLSSACLSADEAEAVHAGADEAAVEAVGRTPIALRAGASVGADEIDGYSENGIGVYLSADDTQALLTVYVVTPAEQAEFMRPTLHLTTQKGDMQWTQDRLFESVTLKAGESRTFAQEADGALMNVEAEVSAL